MLLVCGLCYGLILPVFFFTEPKRVQFLKSEVSKMVLSQRASGVAAKPEQYNQLVDEQEPKIVNTKSLVVLENDLNEV